MARSSFTPSKRFHMVVSEAALGPRDARGGLSGGASVSVRRGSGRRPGTVQDIADQIIETAKAIVDSETGLPSVTRGGGRNIGYDFRTEGRRGRTYRASFSTEIREENGRMVIYVINSHEHAQDVEFGTGPPEVVNNSTAKHGYHRIPITEAAYAKIRRRMKAKRKKLTGDDRILANWKQRGRYYAQRGSRIQKLLAFDKRSTERSRSERERKAEAIRRRTNTKKAAEALALSKRAYEITGRKPRPDTFVSRDKRAQGGGRPYLYSRTFRTYDGYAILQRAAGLTARNRF